jgi:hypothetical protein
LQKRDKHYEVQGGDERFRKKEAQPAKSPKSKGV